MRRSHYIGAFVVLLFLSFLSVSGKSQTVESADKIIINKRPFIDFSNRLKNDLASGDTDLNASFLVELKATLSREGLIDPNTAVYTRKEGDIGLIELAMDAIESFNVSGYFQYLSLLNGKEFLLTVQQDGSDFQMKFECGMEPVSRARSVSIFLNAAIDMAKRQKSREEASEADKKDLSLLNRLSVEDNDRQVILLLKIPKHELHYIILSSL